MKALVLYDYPPSPGGLATQGDLLFRGLTEIGVEAHAANVESAQEKDPDWHDRYETYNRPGEYHNGGVWPFVCGFYIAALVALGRFDAAENRLEFLTDLVRLSTRPSLKFGFNEWISATSGTPKGEDWQTWSAAMYLYAADCVRNKRTTVFDNIRGDTW